MQTNGLAPSNDIMAIELIDNELNVHMSDYFASLNNQDRFTIVYNMINRLYNMIDTHAVLSLVFDGNHQVSMLLHPTFGEISNGSRINCLNRGAELIKNVIDSNTRVNGTDVEIIQ